MMIISHTMAPQRDIYVKHFDLIMERLRRFIHQNYFLYQNKAQETYRSAHSIYMFSWIDSWVKLTDSIKSHISV